MKLTSLQLGFGASILFHAIVGSVILSGGLRPQPPAFQQENSVVTLTLVAAPAEPANKPVPPKRVEIKPVAIPVSIETVKQPVPLAPIPSPQPIISIPSPAPPVVKPTPKIIVRSDNSSTKAGPDATTVEARPSVLAKPNYLRNPEPPYPALARQRHQEGLVVLMVKVTAQGRAAQIVIKKTSGFKLLDEAAQQAVYDWEFEPARIGSLAFECTIEVPVRFKLVN